jgi:hypothetical protein
MIFKKIKFWNMGDAWPAANFSVQVEKIFHGWKWLEIKLPTTPFGFGYLSSIIR